MNVLIPYNFTENDQKSIDFVCHEYPDRAGAEITLFHAFTRVPQVDVRNNPIMEKVSRPTSFLRLKQEEKKAELEHIREKLVGCGFESRSVYCLFTPVKQDVATDIIRLVTRKKFNALVLNRSPGNIINYFSRSISRRITRHFGRDIKIYIVS